MSTVMSLLNQYFKTIAGQDAHKESSEPLPSLLKARKNFKDGRARKTALLILVFMVACALITWGYGNQKSSSPITSGVARAVTGLSAEDMQRVDPEGMKTSPTTTSSDADSPGSAQNFPLSGDRTPKPELATPSVPPPHTMGFEIAAPSGTDMPISSREKEIPVSMVSDKIPPRPLSPSQQSEAVHESALPVVTTWKKSETKELSPEAARNFYQLGLLALQEGDLSNAEHFLRETLKHSPNDIDALLNLSNVYIRQKRLELAVQNLETIRQLDPDSVKSLNNLGYVALQRKDFKAARNYYEEVLKRNPVDEVALVNLAYLAQIENKRTEALDCYEKIISIHPENGNALINAAHLMTQEGKIDRATQLYNRSLTLKSIQNNRELAQKIKQRIQVLLSYE